MWQTNSRRRRRSKFGRTERIGGKGMVDAVAHTAVDTYARKRERGREGLLTRLCVNCVRAQATATPGTTSSVRIIGVVVAPLPPLCCFYLRRSRQVLEVCELFFLLGGGESLMSSFG